MITLGNLLLFWIVIAATIWLLIEIYKKVNKN